MKTASLWSRLAGLAATPLAPRHYLALVRSPGARVEAVRDEAAGVRTLTLRPPRGWTRHRPGQHVRVQLAVDGRLATRTYSISSAPDPRRVDITVKVQGRVSRALHETQPGAYLSIGPAEGDFVLPDNAKHLLFVTGGSGITPIASMVRTHALDDIAHVHYTRGDAIFGDELRALAAAHPGYKLAIVHTQDDPRRLSPERLDALVPDWRTRESWACGPASLLAAIPFHHVERFTAALAPRPANDPSVPRPSGRGTETPDNDSGGLVRFRASGTESRSDGRLPLLRVAEDAGLCPPHGCRMGICHSCDATLVAGRARDLRTGDVAEAGARIQICVCAAAGDVDLDL